MKNKFIFITNIILKNILLASLLLTQSCSSLTKSKIINTKQNEAISVLELKIIIDDKEENMTCIRIYGIGENNDNICVRIDNFTPWVYIDLPPEKNWTATRLRN